MVKPVENETAVRARSEPEAVSDRGYELVVVEGPNAGSRIAIDATQPSPLLVGTSPVSGFPLTDPAVSRRHAALEVAEHGLRLTDLSSTNGTFVNGVRVNEAYLRGGEAVEIGATTVRVEAIERRGSSPVSTATAFGRLVGASLEMRRLYPLCERIAASDVPVIIEGETGTGKEVLAEALYEEGPRSTAPFVVFDCTSVPPELFESALFGHEKGAFTGAVSTRRGAFEQANGGTLFIDEVGDLAPPLQPKLLRAIERSEVQRVGSEKWTKVNVRVIAATRRDLDQEVAAGRFRDDLFFRLCVTRVELPPLRRRTGDVAILARHFWRALGGRTQPFPEDFLSRTSGYAWPGNVRELRNAVARRLALGDLAHVGAADEASPDEQTPAGGEGLVGRVLALDLPLTRARQELIQEFERVYVERVLERHGGNIRRAAAASGIARRYFQILRARQAKE
jgi:two-component system, NtrC family, response regulator HydG